MTRDRLLPGGQRFERIADRRRSGSGPVGRLAPFFVRDDEPGATCAFDYADVVAEGFRAIRTGERVRFLTDPGDPGRAIYVIRVDLPAARSTATS